MPWAAPITERYLHSGLPIAGRVWMVETCAIHVDGRTQMGEEYPATAGGEGGAGCG
jgi:hypothetical protein